MTIDVSQVIDFQAQLIYRFGGEPGVRDYQMLDSSINSIYQTFDQKDLYPTIIEKATRLAFNLISSHPFLDGNKRIGMHMLITYLRFENISFYPSPQEVISVGFSIAKGQLTYELLLAWVTKNIEK
jgi:death-on-curing protein